jgi:hypothetical protein
LEGVQRPGPKDRTATNEGPVAVLATPEKWMVRPSGAEGQWGRGAEGPSLAPVHGHGFGVSDVGANAWISTGHCGGTCLSIHATPQFSLHESCLQKVQPQCAAEGGSRSRLAMFMLGGVTVIGAPSPGGSSPGCQHPRGQMHVLYFPKHHTQ